MRTLGVMLLATAVACGGPSGPDESEVTLKTSANSYSWNAPGGFSATLVNTSGQRLYSNVGDGFGGSVQQTLFVAQGTDAAFEREIVAGTWAPVAAGILIEGSRIVELQAGGRFTLTGIPTDPVDGTYRVRFRYFSSPDRSGPASEVLSNTFTFR